MLAYECVFFAALKQLSSIMLSKTLFEPLFFLAVSAELVRSEPLQFSNAVSFQKNLFAEAGGVHNVKIEYKLPLNGHLSIHYGPCDAIQTSDCHHALGETHVGDHPLAKRHEAHQSRRPSTFVWIPPDDITSEGCLQAYSGNVLVGKSTPVTVGKRKQRRWTAAADVMEAEGPWFDGVEYLKEKEPTDVFVAKAKTQSIGIVGGGMSGLMTSHLLESVGFHDWKIIEASDRIGGRVHTAYLNGSSPDDYQYQEMGPMRFPVSITYPDTNETLEINDHKMVFQLAGVLNELNNHDPDYAVNFIEWIQNSPNVPASTTKRKPDGTVPSVMEVEEKPRYQDNLNLTYSNVTAVYEAQAAYDEWSSKVSIEQMAKNVYRAHKKAVDEGLFDFSEAGYLNYALKYGKNITDQVDSFLDNSPTWLYDNVYFSATYWRTIDKGLTRLPAAFGPQVINRTMFGTAIQGIWF